MSKEAYDVIANTIQTYTTRQAWSAIFNFLTYNDSSYFTNKDNSRVTFLSSEKPIEGMLDLYVANLTTSDPKKIAPIEQKILDIYKRAVASGLNEEIAKKTVAAQLAIRLKEQEDTFIGIIATRIIKEVDVKEQLKTEEPKLVVEDFYPETVEELRGKVLSGKNLAQCDSAALGKYLTAYQDIGNHRENQEDSALICESDDKKMVFLAVCDGVGGVAKGEEASDYAVNELKTWFNRMSKDPRLTESDYAIMESLREKIITLGKDLFIKFKGTAQTTLVCALIRDGRALIANVGDSRAYIMKGEELTQVTTDDSMAHEAYIFNENWIQSFPEENMRFYSNANVITKALGASATKETAIPTFTPVGASEYDRIILCSDGVSDCLGTRNMVAVSKSCPREKFAEKLVKAALMHVSILPLKMRRFKEDFETRIRAGKDNTTAVVFDKDAYNQETGEER